MAGELVWKHLGLADVVARQCGLDAALVADVGLAALEKAEQTFDPEHGSTFYAYASVILKNEYVKYMRTHPIMYQGTGGFPIASRQKEDEPVFTDKDINALRDNLSDEEYSLLCEYYVDKKSMQEIADARGVVRQWIWVKIKKITEKATGNA